MTANALLTGPTDMQACYRLCDVGLSIEAQRPPAIADFDAVYGAFREDGAKGTPQVACVLDTDSSGRGSLMLNGAKHEVVMRDPRGEYASWLVLDAVAAASEAHALLHASAILLGDGAALFVGPTGHGKSTLARAVADQGATPLNDDITPVRISSGIAEHFPKGQPEVRVDSRLNAPVSAVFLLRSQLSTGQIHLAVDRWPTTSDEAEGFCDRHGLTVSSREGYCEISGASAAPGAAETLRSYCAAEGITILRDLTLSEASFRSSPELQRMAISDAAPWLVADMFGRQGRPTVELVWELACALERAAFWRLSPGPPDETAKAVVQVVEQLEG